MDITSKAVSLSGTLHLRDANDELLYDEDGEAVVVVLHSPGSKPYAKASAAQQNRLVDKMKRKGVTSQTAEQKAAESAEFLADCTIEFKNLEYKGFVGRDLAIGVYSDTTIGFISDQVAKHLGDWSNFTKGATQD